MALAFIDTSLLVAYFNESDSLHAKAHKAISSITRPLLVHEYVLLESATVLMSRETKELADVFVKIMLTNADFRLIYSDKYFLQESAESFLESKTKQISFVDAALLALSDGYPILTFDNSLQKAIEKRKALKNTEK